MRAMAKAKASLLLHPVAEQVRQGEIDYFTRGHCYPKQPWAETGNLIPTKRTISKA